MSRRKKDNQVPVTDEFSNPVFRLGFGTQAPLEATEYPLTRLTDNYALLNSMYRSGSIMQSVVDIVPRDMLREWFDITGTIKPEDMDAMDRAMRRIKLRERLDEGLRWGRLYGGAVGIILIKGHENKLDKPLDPKSILPESFAGLLILDRWSGVSPELGLVTDIADPDFGLPEYYDINSGENGKVVARVHHSRVVRFTGRELPYYEKLAEVYWGESEIEPMFTDIRLYDNVMANMGNLTFRANIDTLFIKNLEQLFSIGSTEQQKRFWNMMQAQSVAQSNFGYRLMDQENTTQNTQYTFTGWNYVIEAVQTNLSAATHIPITKLFGRSPGGMNATGDSDMQNYYDFIDGQRESKLRPILERLLPILCMSVWGEIPEDVDISFPPLWTPTAMELAQIAGAKSQAIIGAFSSNLLTQGQAMKELKKLSDETGMFDAIEDKDIQASMDKTFQDITAMADPMAGLFGGEGPGEEKGAKEDIPFETKDEFIWRTNKNTGAHFRINTYLDTELAAARENHAKYSNVMLGKRSNKTPTPVKGFKTNSRKSGHTKDHMDSVMAKDARHYEDMAEDFLSHPLKKSMEEIKLATGERLRYDYATGEFGMVDAGGHILTYYIPNTDSKQTPQSYWEGMVARHGKY